LRLVAANAPGTLGFASILGLSACAAGRPAVVGPVPEPGGVASGLERATVLQEPARVDFRWELNEEGSRVRGVGVARVEPPYRARLDLFLEGGETVTSAAVVDGELRLPPGAPDDVLPPVDLMWVTLGVFRPLEGAELVGADRLDNDAERLRYRYDDGRELDYETTDGRLRMVELLEGRSVVQWVRVSQEPDERFPTSVTYRNLQDFRELVMERTAWRPSDAFDPAIWDPR
jgi:hypothetical protein